MEDYQKMYTLLFNEVTTSIDLLGRQRDAITAEINRLKYAQSCTEEIFLKQGKIEL